MLHHDDTMSSTFLATDEVSLVSSAIETEHVYRVYDSIATHWHHTRGRRKVYWHRVKDFIEALPAGSLIADVGSGDGKYFGVNPSCFALGCDRSLNLLDVSKDLQFETFCCDAVKLPLVSDSFDAVLCIAVLHHLASVDRRISLIKELLRICAPGGNVMVQAWALEQESNSKRSFKEQDVLVPWRLQKHFRPEEVSASSTDINEMPEGPCTHMVEENGELVFQRYCHVYKEGELEELCASISNCKVVQTGFDKGNWFLQLQRR